MYTINIKHKGDKKETTYPIYRKDEAEKRVWNISIGRMLMLVITQSQMMITLQNYLLRYPIQVIGV